MTFNLDTNEAAFIVRVIRQLHSHLGISSSQSLCHLHQKLVAQFQEQDKDDAPMGIETK